MQAKWYFGTLFLLFIYFGAFQDQVSIPNQEIALEFVDSKTNDKDIENTIANVKEKLLKVGVANITINKTQKGTLKISYYSTITIDAVKKELVKDTQFVLNKDSDNEEQSENSSNYNIDIYELKNQTDISNLDDKFVFEIKYNSDRFTTLDYYALAKNVDPYKTDQLFKTAYKISKNHPFSKDRTSYKEPEVRAGPKNYTS
ncbi:MULTISPECIES: hypothetical protein [Polaribacter]|uniref:Uncharacterized protein n=1 Tax=Polaribacter butkevichii TaxID=218490 RepID=A0A2P6C961_9FLAO|nr:hypothetical protein [Polaribacter butkevichii]PQJ69444.1 hypothetical protein BTO14_15670 [Polaribacter butkevichii]